MNGYDCGILLNAIRATVPTRKRCEFDELMYRGAMSEQASDALRFGAQLRKFEVITGGAA
jgi:hypothetical protein